MFKVIETRNFPKSIISYFEKNVKTCKVGLKYIDAKIISFERCNIKLMTAFRIIVYSKSKIFEVLYIGKDEDNQKKFYLNSLENPTTIKEIASLVKEMA